MDNALRKLYLFQGLSDADLEPLAAHLHLHTIAAGETIFNMHDPGDGVFFIESGRVVVFDPAASSMPVRAFEAGSMFGELAVIDRKPRTLSARAESDCRLWVMSAEDFERLILEDKTLVMHILNGLSASVRYTTNIFMEATNRSIHDALTGLYNRSLYESLLAVLEENRPAEVTVILIDIDGLKRVNDTLGHPAGDELIQKTAAILRAAFRAEDAVARIGGDEFAIILPRVNAAGGEEAAARILRQLEAYNRQHPQAPISFSLGVATGAADCPLEEIAQQADAKMYANKQAHKAKQAAA